MTAAARYYTAMDINRPHVDKICMEAREGSKLLGRERKPCRTKEFQPDSCAVDCMKQSHVHAHHFVINPGESVGDKRRSVLFKHPANKEGQEIDNLHERIGQEN